MSVTVTHRSTRAEPGTCFNDLTGQRFGKLYAVGATNMRARSNVVWECLCDCGETTFQRSGHLVNGDVQSCGCSKRGHHRARLADDRSPPDLRYRTRTPPAEPVVRKAWTEDDITSAQEWRAQPIPVPFNIIGQRLGRSAESVRIKLFDLSREQSRPAGNRPVGYPKDQREAIPEAPRIENPDRDICDLVMADGGFSAFSTYRIRGPFIGLCLPVLGPGNIPRPAGWRDGTTPETPEQQAHLSAIQAQWMTDRNFLHPPMQGED